MRLLLLESYYGGSHKSVADGIVAHSAHDVTLKHLPARFWKWRMRSAALWFAHSVPDPRRYDLVVTTSIINLSDLKALWPASPPIVHYMHESQLSYPRPAGEPLDLHLGFTDVVNAVVADAVVFNSRFHRDAFLSALPAFIRQFPDHRPGWAASAIKPKCVVCYPGMDVGAAQDTAKSDADDALQTGAVPADTTPPPGREGLPIVIWNHRWEFDKQPEAFFEILTRARSQGARFNLALLGESSQVVPTAFIAAQRAFRERIVQFGYVADRSRYLQWLRRGAVVVSTAIQENFGISVLEAIACGCRPLLPRRLSYPELIPAGHHAGVLYDSTDDAAGRLAALVAQRERAPESLVQAARAFSWSKRIGDFDALFERFSRRRAHPASGVPSDGTAGSAVQPDGAQ